MRTLPALVVNQDILGVSVLSCRADTACELIEARIVRRIPTRIAFLNANLSLLATERPDLHEALKKFVVFNDGIGVDIASWILNRSRFQSNLNGTDFVPYLLDHVRRPLRIFLLGSKAETLNKAVCVMQQRWPRHVIVGHVNGYFSEERAALILQLVVDARPDVVLVAMGNPRQELWISQNIPHCAPCAFGVGALLDFLAGNVRRAPRWMRALRSEWMFRLAIEPARLWRRYLVGNARFLACVLAARAARRVGSNERSTAIPGERITPADMGQQPAGLRREQIPLVRRAAPPIKESHAQRL